MDARGNRINTTDPVSLTQFNPGTTQSSLYDGLGASGDLTTWPTANLGAVRRYLLAQPQGPYNTDFGGSFDVKEITQNVYTQLNFESGQWRGNVGVRLLDTTDKSEYWQSADNGASYSRVAETHDYRKALPSFNVAYDVTDDAVLRFSVAKVMARPRYGDLAGSFTVNSGNGNLTASGGNPDLRPYESTNYDLAAEWYFAPSSMLSGEVFYRDISSYIVSTTVSEFRQADRRGNEQGIYQITTPTNASDAKVKGASINYQQTFGLGFGLQGELHLCQGRRQHRFEPALPVARHLQRDPVLGTWRLDGARQLQLPLQVLHPARAAGIGRLRRQLQAAGSDRLVSDHRLHGSHLRRHQPAGFHV